MAIEIDWNEAPEGATHVVTFRARPEWRKVTEEAVYNWDVEVWVDRKVFDVKKYLDINKDVLTPRPAPFEALLPNGLKWFENYTYWNSHGENGFFFDANGFRWKGVERGWGGVGYDYWLEHPHTIKRFPEGVKGQAVKKEGKPEPKKPVGWWS